MTLSLSESYESVLMFVMLCNGNIISRQLCFMAVMYFTSVIIDGLDNI